MKIQKLTPIVLLGLALMAQAALTQTSPKSKPAFTDPILGRLLSGSHPSASRPPLDPEHDAVARGLANAKTYKFASADYPGAALSVVLDTNTSTVLGYTQLPGPSGFTLKGGTYQLVSLPNSLNNAPRAINTAGNMVGTYTDASNVTHGFLDVAGVVTNIDYIFAQTGGTTPYDTNDGGEIVGYYIVPDFNNYYGLSTTDGVTFTEINFPGAVDTQALGVNSAGQIVGQWYDGTSFHGFLLSGSSYTSFDFPLATGTAAASINDYGEIAGSFTDASNVTHGFILSKGAYNQVDIAGAADTYLIRIKNNGRIVGYYLDTNGEDHGFIGH